MLLGLQIRNLYISVVHKSNGDLNVHLQSEKHRSSKRSCCINEDNKLFYYSRSKCKHEITAAEGTLAFLAVKHNHSFLSMDCKSVLLKKIFPDSNVAKKFSSERTKTEKVITNVAYLRNILLMLF